MLSFVNQLKEAQNMAPDFNQMTSLPQNVQEMFKDTPIQDLKWNGNDYFRSDEYLALPAEQKQGSLLEMMRGMDQGTFPSVAGMFTEKMDPTFDTKGDAMPNGKLWGVRTKYIHSVGAVGEVKFIAEPTSPYSGVFQGADHGFVRLTSAAEPSEKQPLSPGISLKLLRDGMDSANVVALYDLNGQPGDWNFFSNTLTNHITMPDTPSGKALAKKLSEATPYIQEVSLKNFATHCAKGIEADEVKYPYSISFEPHDDVKDLFPSYLSPDPDYMAYMKQLPTVPADSNLYNVYAYDQPEDLGGEKTLIGRVQLDGWLLTSKWADENLYFRHERVSDDIEDHPDWEQYEPKFEKKGSWGCPFGYSSQKE